MYKIYDKRYTDAESNIQSWQVYIYHHNKRQKKELFVTDHVITSQK